MGSRCLNLWVCISLPQGSGSLGPGADCSLRTSVPFSLRGCEANGCLGLQLESGWGWGRHSCGGPHKGKGQEAVTLYCCSFHRVLVTAPIQTQMQILKVWGHLWQSLNTSLMISTASPEVPGISFQIIGEGDQMYSSHAWAAPGLIV